MDRKPQLERAHRQDVTESAPKVSTLEKFAERSTIHIDAAACIKWTFIGTALLVVVLALVVSGKYELAAGIMSLPIKP